MIVKKVRGEDRVDKIILSRSEYEVCKKMQMHVEIYVRAALLQIAKKRRWKWYLEKHA